jgi:hypothetical protein
VVTTEIVLMDRDEAERITQSIIESGEQLAERLAEAHEREAWRALGYKSWSAYVDSRFTFTRQHSYKLIAQGSVNKALKEAGSEVRATVSEAADLSHNATLVTEGTNATVVEQVITERRQTIGAPKPGGKRRGFQAPDEKARQMAETLEEWNDAVDGETTLPPQFVRVLERIRDASITMLEMHEQASRNPVSIEDWSA